MDIKSGPSSVLEELNRDGIETMDACQKRVVGLTREIFYLVWYRKGTSFRGLSV